MNAALIAGSKDIFEGTAKAALGRALGDVVLEVDGQNDLFEGHVQKASGKERPLFSENR